LNAAGDKARQGRAAKHVRMMAVVFLVAATTRVGLVCTFDVEQRGFGFSDLSYLEYARNLSEGRGFYMDGVYGDAGPDKMYAFRPPLFPLVWGLAYRATRGAYRPMWLAFSLLSAAGCVLAYRVGLRLFPGRAAATVGALGCAVYPPLVFHGVNLMTEPFFIFFSLLFVLFLLRAWDSGLRRDALAAGVWLGLAVLSRSVLVAFAPIAGVWLLFRGASGPRPRRKGLELALSLAAGATLTLSPWIVRNAVVLKAFVPTTTDGGHGFYVAHHPKALASGADFYIPRDWRRELGLRAGERLDEVEMQRRLYRRALGYLVRHPGRWARRVASRALRMWRPYPHRTDIISRFQVIVYACSFLPLVPFMLYGLACAHVHHPDRRAKYVLIDLLVLYTTFIHAFFLAMLRYRVPLMPFLLLFAGWGAHRLYCRLRTRPGRNPETSARGFDGLAEDYDETLPAHVRDHYLAKRLALIGKVFRPSPENPLLDVGCGTGALLEGLGRAGFRACGADASLGMLRVALARRGCRVVRAACERLPFAEGTFAGAVCVATLHHLSAREAVDAAVGEMLRVVRPGGKIVVWDHNPANPYWRVIMAKVPQDSGAERLVGVREVKDALVRHGAERVSVLRLGFVPDFVPRRLMPLARAVERCIEALPLVRRLTAHNVFVATKGRNTT